MAKPPLDFKLLAKQRIECDQSHLTIVGGVIAESAIAAWLAQWQVQHMPWRLWEWVSDLKLEKDTALKGDYRLIERGRLFGAGGDLVLRRDGNRFHWNFVGPKIANVPTTPGMRDFWREHPGKKLYRIEQQAILWGAWNQNYQRWHDNRVAWAKLEYPLILKANRNVYAHFREYLDGGRVAFVWMVDLGDKKADPVLADATSDGGAS